MSEQIKSGRHAWRFVVPLLVGGVIAVLPAPPGLTIGAWHYLACFLAVMTALILEPVPSAAVGLIGVTVIAALGLMFTPEQRADPAFKPGTDAVRWALAGFANGTVWLIFAAFMFSMGYEKTGLGRRIALWLVKTMGARTLGLGYAIMLADLVLAPFTPSNTARSGGTIFPVIRNIPAIYGSAPGESARRCGSYIMWVGFASTCVTSSMFATALAPNLLALEMTRKLAGINITWMDWFLGFLPVGGSLLLLLPWLIYKIYPPEIKRSDGVPRWAAQELALMGRITRQEVIMSALAMVALVLWIFGGSIVDPTLVALIIVVAMLLTGVAEWDDILANRQAWNVLIWFATLAVLAEGLNKVGFIGWFAKAATGWLAGYPPAAILVLLVAMFFFVHYFFASLTAHTTAVLPVVLAAGMAVPGLSMPTFALLLAYSLGIMGVITPYATGPAPIYFMSGYIPRRTFWILGFIFGLIFLGALLVVGTPWLGVVPLSLRAD